MFQVDSSAGHPADVLGPHGVQIDPTYEPVPLGDSLIVRGWVHPDRLPAVRAAGVNASADVAIAPADLE